MKNSFHLKFFKKKFKHTIILYLDTPGLKFIQICIYYLGFFLEIPFPLFHSFPIYPIIYIFDISLVCSNVKFQEIDIDDKALDEISGKKILAVSKFWMGLDSN